MAVQNDEDVVAGPPGRRLGLLRYAYFRYRMARSTALLLACDVLVLAAYLIWRPQPYSVALWVTGLAVLAGSGSYRARLHLSLLSEIPALIAALGAAAAFVIALYGFLGREDVVHELVLMALVGIGAHLMARGLAYAIIHWIRRTGRVRYRTLILGGGDVSQRLGRVLAHHPEYGLEVVGYLDDRPSLQQSSEGPWHYLGTMEQLPSVLRDHRINALLVGYGLFRDRQAIDWLRGGSPSLPTVFVVPRMFEIGRRRGRRDQIGAFEIVRHRHAVTTGLSWRLKRALDISVAGLMLVLASPVLALVALAVRWETGRGIIFSQQRVGLNGQTFQVLKFRSMPQVEAIDSDTAWSHTVRTDIGPVGRFIRKTSLDELPQLINVLRGDMTLVGPRPERPHFVQEFSSEFPHYEYRHRVPAGLTGLAQVSGLRGDTSIDERAQYDNYYIENWSLWLDVQVMLRTVRQLVRPDGS